MSSRTGSRMLSFPMGRRMQGKDKVNTWLCVRAGIKLPFFGFFYVDVISHYFSFFSKSKDGSSSSGMRALWQGLSLQWAQIPRDLVSPWPQDGCAQRMVMAGVSLTGTKPRRELGSERGEGQAAALAVLMSLQIFPRKLLCCGVLLPLK